MKIDEILLWENQEQILIEMPHEEAVIAQRVLSSVFKKYMKLTFDMSQHMKNRVLNKGEKGRRDHGYHARHKDEDRDKDVTKEELFTLFNKILKDPKHRKTILDQKQFGREIEGIIRDHETDVNVVFKVAYQYRHKFPTFRIITIKRDSKFESRRDGDLIFDV